MFDRLLEDADAGECADLLHASLLENRAAAARQLAAVARWADLHDPETGQMFRTEAGEQVGAEGTPVVACDAVVELGVLLQCSTLTARYLLRDALDIRHRLPRHWAAIMALQVDPWKVRKVAAATRTLTPEQAAWVDGQVVAAVCDLPFGRAETIVAGKVVAADPAGHAARRKAEQERRFVALGRRSTAGVQMLYARGAAGDLARLMAMVNHLADLLDAHGSTESADERRAKALGLLANPAMACLVLAKHHDTAASDPGTTPVQSESTPEPEPHVTPVDLAIEMGRFLAGLGERVWDRLRPRSILYVHLHQDALAALSAGETHRKGAVARVEEHGPVDLKQLEEWLGRDRVTVRPVAYPLAQAAVDDYQVPRPLEEAVIIRNPFEVFPYGTLPSRRADSDHTRPYRHRRGTAPADPDAPDDGWKPGQTGLHNLAPLGRTHHRAKTFGGFVCHQPLPGVYYWRIPVGRWYRVDNEGTSPLGTATPQVIGLMDSPEEEERSPMERHLGRCVADRAA